MLVNIADRILRLDIGHDYWCNLFQMAGPLSLALLPFAGLQRSAATSCLCPQEIERLADLTLPKRRSEWLGGRIAAKYACLAAIGLPAASMPAHWRSLHVGSEVDGRPVLHNRGEVQLPRMDVSISHSHGVAVAMAAGDGRCGVDLQKIIPSVLRIERRFADQEECTLLAELTGTGPEMCRLTLLWAAKEALRKMIGTGELPGFMTLKLDSVCQASAVPFAQYFLLRFTKVDRRISRSTKKILTAAVVLPDAFVLAFAGLASEDHHTLVDS
jgi:phosphopantetheinyl transferase